MKCYVIYASGRNYHEIFNVFLNEQDAVNCCIKMSSEYQGDIFSNPLNVYYLERDLIEKQDEPK